MQAYSGNLPGSLGPSHHIMLCPPFFGRESRSFDYFRRRFGTDHYIAQVVDLWTTWRAMTIFHETYHCHPTVNGFWPILEPEVYSAKSVYDLARLGNVQMSQRNPQSYTFAALAILLMQRFEMSDIPLPLAYATRARAANPRLETMYQNNIHNLEY